MKKAKTMKTPQILSINANKKYFSGTTEKNSVSYKVGEEIVFNVALKADGSAVGCECFRWRLSADDGSESEGISCGETGTLEIKTMLKKEGFVRLNVKACHANGEPIEGVAEYNGGAGANIEEIAKIKDEPNDFDEFWQRQLSRLDNVTPELLECEEVEAPQDSHIGYKVKLGFYEGDYGNYVSGYITVPRNASCGKVKIKMWYNGYGIMDPDMYCEADTAIFTVNAHSIEVGMPPEYYRDQPQLAGYGFLNNDDPGKVYFKEMLLRDVQALRFMKSYFGEQGTDKRLAGLWNGEIDIVGGSQGGFQAVAVAVLESEGVKKLGAYCPWLCDIGGYGVNGRQRSNFMPEYTPALEYFDTVNFAKRIRSDCRVTVGTVGLGDYTANPAGNTALYNSIPQAVSKEIVYIQNRTHAILPVEELSYKIHN